MTSNASLHNLQNPFFKQNPYRPPQKFYSQEKIISVPIQSEFASHPHFPYHPTFSTSMVTQHSRGAPLQKNRSPQQYFDEEVSMSKFAISSKDRNIGKRSMKIKQNPFLRKNLIPLVIEEPLPEYPSLSSGEFRDRHQRLFGSGAREEAEIDSPHYTVKIGSRKDLLHNKQNQDMSYGESAREKLSNLYQRSNRKLQTLEECHPKHLTSELKIQLRSQKFIEEMAITDKSRRQEIRERSLREEGVPAVIKVLGRTFHFQDVEYRC